MFLNNRLNAATTGADIDKALAPLKIPVKTGKKPTKNGVDLAKMRWCPDPKEFYVAAEIVSVNGNEATVKLLDKNEKRTVLLKSLEEMNPPIFDNCEDMADLTHLNDASVIHNLRSRYSFNLIYTYSGLFCVAVNPYYNLPIYGSKVMMAYRGVSQCSRPPHIFSVTDTTYTSMLREKENQSILITGESGSGKTENTKKVIQYFTFVATLLDSPGTSNTSQVNLENKIISANPLLESYGNAKTIKNDNSSRFGKFIQIHFSNSGRISGANINTYLLEKSRVTFQHNRERNYHIFYQLLSNAIPELHEKILLESNPSKYLYVNRGAVKADTIDDCKEMLATDQAINILGFSEDEKQSMYRITAAILIFGNAKWKQRNREEQAESDGTDECEKVAYLLEIDVGDLMKCLLRPRIKVGSQYVNKGQSMNQVIHTVGALSKSIYERLFNWIVQRINDTLAASSKRKYFIGVLDIAGFEIFEQNSFEQLCINYTNERLQQFFNSHMFILEQEEYLAEQIPWDFIDFGLDLQPCIDLIEKPMGIFSILEEECIIPKGADSGFVSKMLEKHAGKHPNIIKIKSGKNNEKAHFGIQHYAGIVSYTVDGWLEKNKDPLNASVAGLFKNSKNTLMATLFKDFGDEECGKAGRVKKTGSMRTISAIHKEQLNRLLTTLRSTQPHFVRCILPNEEKKRGKFNVKLVLQQLHCNGVLEGIRICRKGYPNRMLFSEFKRNYGILAGKAIPKGYVDGRKVTEKIIEVIGISSDCFKLGYTKVFFKAGILGNLESLREQALSRIVTGLQSRIRSYLVQGTYDLLCRRRLAIEALQKNCRFYLGFRNWSWWRLYTKLKPLLTVARQEEEMSRLKEEYDKAKSTIEKEALERAELESHSAKLLKEKDSLQAQLDLNKALLDAAEEKANSLLLHQTELESHIDDFQATISNQEDTINTLRYKLRVAEDKIAEKQSEIEQLKLNLANLKSQLEACLSENAEMEERLKLLNSKLNSQQIDIQNRDKTISSLQEENRSLQEKNKQLTKLNKQQENNLRTLDLNVQDLTKTVTDLRKDKSANVAEIDRLNGLVNSTRNEIKKINCDNCDKDELISSLRKELESEKAISRKQETIIGKLKEENEEAKEELENSQTICSQMQSEKKTMAEEMLYLKKELENVSHAKSVEIENVKKKDLESERLVKQLDALTQKHEKSETELKKKLSACTVKAEYREIKDEAMKALKQSEKERKALDRELDEIRNKLRASIAAKESLDAKFKQISLEFAGSQNRVNEREIELFELRKTIKTLSVELEEEKSRSEANHDEILVLSKLNQKLKTENAEVSKENELLEKDRKQLDREIRLIEQKLAESETETDVLNRELAEARKAFKDLQEQQNLSFSSAKNELEAKIRELEQEKRDFRLSLSDSHAELSETTTRLTNATTEISGLKRQIEKLRSALDGANDEISKLEKKEEQMEMSAEEDRMSISKLNARIDCLNRESNEKARFHLQLENDLKAADATIKKLRREIVDLKDLILRAETEKFNENDNDKRIRLLEFEIQDKNSELDRLGTELSEYRSSADLLNSELVSVRNKLEQDSVAHLELVHLTKKEFEEKLRSMVDDNDDLKRENELLKKERGGFEGSMSKLSKRLEAAGDEIKGLNKRLSRETENLKVVIDELALVKVEKSELVRRLEGEQLELRSVRNELAVVDDRNSANERMLRGLEREKQGLVDELKDLRQAKSDFHDERLLFEKRTIEFESEIDDLRDLINVQRNQLAEFQSASDRTKEILRQKNESISVLIGEKDAVERRFKEFQDNYADESAQRDRDHSRSVHDYETKLRCSLLELEAVSVKSGESGKALRTANRKLKEMQAKLEEQEKVVRMLNETVDQLQRRNNVLREQANESDRNAAANLAKYKKAAKEVTLAVDRAVMAEDGLSRIKARSVSRLSGPTFVGVFADDCSVVSEDDKN